jgi:RNA polymerase sigma-70 factor (ECF subfamily)
VSDEELIMMFQNGDSEAFEKLFLRYKQAIFHFIFRFCKNSETAQELTQDVFSKIITKSDTFRHDSRFSTWIYTIARNITIDHSRKMTHRKQPSLDEKRQNGLSLLDTVESKTHQADRTAISNNLKTRILEAIDNLPEEQKEVFILREHNGLSFEEISEITASKTGTVKSRMRYALESLRTSLNEYKQYAKELS